jgi:Putative Flp pilus-assembly TadE/G-like
MKRKPQAGQAIASVALALVVLTGIAGLAIDMGYLRYEKRRMQAAADSAAVAGASELQYPSGNPTMAALNDSKANGFEDGVKGVSVTLSNPPSDAPFSAVANANRYVEVKVHRNVPTFFMRIFGVNMSSMTASAVAELGSSRGCVYSLNLVLGITLGGNNLSAPNCGVVDNAVLDLGGGCITASSIGVVLSLLGSCANPAPVIGISPSADPLAYLTAPAVGACLPNPNINQPAGPPVVLPPGTYCGITVAPTNVVAVTFSPGLYVVTGAPGLQIQGPSTVTGNGVTFFVTNGAQVQITGPGNTSLTAPADTTGGIPGGVLFFQDRANLQPATITNPNLSLTGALYFPSAPLTLASNSPAAPYLILVAQSIQLQGNVSIGTDYSSLTNGSPIKAAVLVQ